VKNDKNKVFVPDDSPLPTVKYLSEKFPFLSSLDFTKTSLADEIIKLNFEVVSREYEDLKYASIEDYFDIEVDMIV
jgi:hypothetical protein